MVVQSQIPGSRSPRLKAGGDSSAPYPLRHLRPCDSLLRSPEGRRGYAFGNNLNPRLCCGVTLCPGTVRSIKATFSRSPCSAGLAYSSPCRSCFSTSTFRVTGSKPHLSSSGCTQRSNLKFEYRSNEVYPRPLLLRREIKCSLKHARRQRPRPLRPAKRGRLVRDRPSKRTTPPERNMIARRRCVLELGPQIPSASLIMLSFRSGSVDAEHGAATRRILRPLEEWGAFGGHGFHHFHSALRRFAKYSSYASFRPL